MPTEAEEEEMQKTMEQQKKMMQEHLAGRQGQGCRRMNNQGGSLMDRGATVEDGPLAVEQVALVTLIQQHRMMAMDSASREVMTKKQQKALARAQEKAKSESDQGRAMNIMQKANHEVQSQLTQEQRMRMSELAQEKMADIQMRILQPQEEAWLSNLNDEQRVV